MPTTTPNSPSKPRSPRSTSESVTWIDNDSAPRVMFAGEDLVLEDLPVGTRCIYPRPPIDPLPHPDAAIRYALSHPEGDKDPLFAQLTPGMSVTIAMDDISLPLPPMQLPDIRQRVLEIVLDQLGEYGVDDVHLVVANALHRKMTGGEIRRMVGDRIYNQYWPDKLYNFDAEDKDNLVVLGETRHGEIVEIQRRAAESDLLIYININLVPMDGGHKSVGTGLASYRTLSAHHTPQAILDSDSYMDPERSGLHSSINRIGRLIEEHLNVFHIETAINNRMFDSQLDFLGRNEDRFSAADWMKLRALRWTLSKLPRAAKREVFMRVPSPFGIIAVHAGEAEPVHDRIIEACYRQYSVPIKGQADVLITGIPYISPYNVNSILNPLLVQVMAQGYFWNMYHGGTPILRDGGVMIIFHPCPDLFHPEHHPSYIEFFHRLLPETRDSKVLQSKYEEQFATDPAYIQMYRHGNAYHGAHPFYMWYWGENGRARTGKLIVVGAEQPHVPEIMGWHNASSLNEAVSEAKSFLGMSNPQITCMRQPPILMCEVS